jgi:hypothetical protein
LQKANFSSKLVIFFIKSAVFVIFLIATPRLTPSEAPYNLRVELLFGVVDATHTGRTAYGDLGLDVTFASYARAYRAKIVACDV